MSRTLFLSASIPDPKRDGDYHATADRVAIRDSVRALVSVAMPHMRIVWGGHPAITPLVRVVVESLELDPMGVTLFQSAWYKDRLPEDNAAFGDVRMIEARPTLEASLQLMRERMLRSSRFDAAVFIGGMNGVEDEFRMFRSLHKESPVYPVGSTGAAALRLYQAHSKELPPELLTDLAYPSLFRRLLDLTPRRETRTNST